MRRCGFTSIELLSSLVIITLLAATFGAVMKDRRDKEWQQRGRMCGPNQRQIGLAIHQYASDNSDTFPLAKIGNGQFGWADSLLPYTKTTRIFQCGLETARPGPTTIVGTDPNYIDYFYNSLLSNTNVSALSMVTITVMLGEARAGNTRHHSNGGTSKMPGVASFVDDSGAPVGAAMRHYRGGGMYAFADGHVKWLKGSDDNTCPEIMNAASGLKFRVYGFAIK